jgi:hypothetical protein
MGGHYFHDLPVYRLCESDYYAARDRFVEANLFPPGSPNEPALRQYDKTNPGANDAIRDHLLRSYGGCWNFNEIVGYIRLHFLGTQVRGEYYATPKKRVVRTRTKTMEFVTWKLAPEIDIESPYNSPQVLEAIRQYIQDCRAEVPRRYVDTSMFEAVAPFIDWGSLFRASLTPNHSVKGTSCGRPQAAPYLER